MVKEVRPKSESKEEIQEYSNLRKSGDGDKKSPKEDGPKPDRSISDKKSNELKSEDASKNQPKKTSDKTTKEAKTSTPTMEKKEKAIAKPDKKKSGTLSKTPPERRYITGMKKSVKIVLVGDGMTGKTSLLVAYTTKAFPQTEYVPTVFDNYNAIEECDGKPINLILWDTAGQGISLHRRLLIGQEDLANIRFLNYRDADCVMCCYSVENRDSFLNIMDKWIPEVSNHCSHALVIITGLKSDLLTDKSAVENLKMQGEKMVLPKEGDQLARKVGAGFHLQCSALKGINVQQLIQKAMKVTLEKKKKMKVARASNKVKDLPRKV